MKANTGYRHTNFDVVKTVASRRLLHASYALVVENVLAIDRIEPPTPAFSEPLPMDLSGLELADPIQTKAVSTVPI
jgi:hypothetical protein